jgi:hypothetical protein
MKEELEILALTVRDKAPLGAILFEKFDHVFEGEETNGGGVSHLCCARCQSRRVPNKSLSACDRDKTYRTVAIYGKVA